MGKGINRGANPDGGAIGGVFQLEGQVEKEFQYEDRSLTLVGLLELGLGGEVLGSHYG